RPPRCESAMTCRAHFQVAHTSYVVGMRELRPLARLVGRRLPGHVEDAIARTEISLRRPVTVQAPLHVERSDPRGQRHLIDSAVAGGASDSLVDVDAVIEIR